MSDNKSDQIEQVSDQVPHWINAKIFEGVLKDIAPDFKEVRQMRIKKALPPGENYTTNMLQVDIDVKLEDNSTKLVNFMVKTSQDTELFREITKTFDCFAVETGMFHDVVPELENIYADVGVQMRFCAKAYALPVTKPYVLLENLKIHGYRNADRLEGLDMCHAKAVLKKLAHWHAASAVRMTTKGMYPQLYASGIVLPERYDFTKSMLASSTKIIIECAKDYKNSDLFYDKLVRLQQQLTEQLINMKTSDTDDFKVLNHGDCWTNNVMFKYDDQTGELLDTLLVDYQWPCVGSPALDLLYFILSSCQYDIKLKEFDHMVHYYHGHLVKCLELLKYSKRIPTLTDLHCMILKNGVWGHVAVITAMAVALCDPSDDASLNNFLTKSAEGDKFKRKMFSNPRYRKHIEVILPWLLYRGNLDL